MKFKKNGWNDLIRYIDDGNYDIDNLVVERAIRTFTMHRKNAQSFDSEDGVQNARLFLHCVRPARILVSTLRNISRMPAKELISGNTDYESLATLAIMIV